MHIYYWGDTHIKNFGMERAKNISPAKSTLKQNILFTLEIEIDKIKEIKILETIKEGETLYKNIHNI